MRTSTAAGPRTIRREKLQLVNGYPVQIALEYSTGRRVQSRIPGAPEQMYYSLTGNREAYLPLEVGRMIDELALQPGQPFTICKYGVNDWEVKPVEPQGAPPAPPQPPPYVPPPAAQHAAARMNGAGETAADLYLSDFRAAIDIVLAGVGLAKERGLLISPAFEDVRAIATHLAIGRAR